MSGFSFRETTAPSRAGGSVSCWSWSMTPVGVRMVVTVGAVRWWGGWGQSSMTASGTSDMKSAYAVEAGRQVGEVLRGTGDVTVVRGEQPPAQLQIPAEDVVPAQRSAGPAPRRYDKDREPCQGHVHSLIRKPPACDGMPHRLADDDGEPVAPR